MRKSIVIGLALRAVGCGDSDNTSLTLTTPTARHVTPAPTRTPSECPCFPFCDPVTCEPLSRND